MPVILPETSWSIWLGEESADVERLKTLLIPYPAGEMVLWPVSKRVNNARR
jgi:putative SOS response-associated peptidase YedK